MTNLGRKKGVLSRSACEVSPSEDAPVSPRVPHVPWGGGDIPSRGWERVKNTATDGETEARRSSPGPYLIRDGAGPATSLLGTVGTVA